MEKILQGYSDIADVLPRVDRLRVVFQKNTDFDRVCALIYSDILEFNRRTYKFFRRKAWHVWFAFDWGLFERRFKLILTRLSSHCDILDKEAAATHFAEMRRYIDQRQDEQEAFELRRENQMAREVLEWLAESEGCQEEFLHKLSDDRHPGTCNWVLKESHARSWIEEDCGTGRLWMTGIPGAGKSFLCSLIIQHLQTREDRSTLYYFCSQQSSGAVACVKILRTLVVQLLRQNIGMASMVHEAFLQKITPNSSPAIRKMLIQILPNVKAPYILIDGIDELDPAVQQELLKSLTDIQKQADYQCKLLITSREEPQIKKFLSGDHLKLEGRTEEGLNLYIENKVKELSGDHPEMEDDLLGRVRERLKDKAHGMFLWVRLVVAMLSKRGSIAEIELAIDELPDGLDEAYRRVLDRIQNLDTYLRHRVFNIFYWICVAQRPVTVHEVVDGIALNADQTLLNRRTRISNVDRDIVEICAPLLEKSNTGVVDLVHFSAKEYLLHPQSGPFIDHIQAHLALTMSCCINLTTCMDLVSGYLKAIAETELESRVVQGNFGLFEYGNGFWMDHLITYLATMNELDPESAKTVGILNRLSRVCKYSCDVLDRVPPGMSAGKVGQALSKLRSFPKLYNLVVRCLLFGSKKQEKLSSFETIDEQQQWLLQTDETYLTCIDIRLGEITEKLLGMDACQLPPHINPNDYEDFVSRFKLPCRYMHCHQFYNSLQDRDKHETTHAFPRFPCQLCDFSVRGFRTRKELERHTRTYHTDLEDTEVPDSLHVREDDLQQAHNAIFGRPAPRTRSKYWNGQGRKAIERSLRQVIMKFEATLTAGNNHERDVLTFGDISSTNLNIVKSKIEEQQYDTLADFKDDLRLLVDDSSERATTERDIDDFCNDALAKATSEFPAFAQYDHSLPQTSAAPRSQGSEPTEECLLGEGNYNLKRDPSTDDFIATFPTSYWSLSEQVEFPALLRRFGRNFMKIADVYQTKTAEEIDEHFTQLIRSGRTDLQTVADIADAEFDDFHMVGPAAGEVELDSETSLLLGSSLGATANPQQQVYIFDPTLAHMSKRPGPAHMNHHDNNITREATQPTGLIDRARVKKRRRRPRALCKFCDMKKEGFHDEYAAQKHHGRFHVATHKVWICDDVSIDKRFLTGCKSCDHSKRYSSKSIAFKHLRKMHFCAETSVNTLSRWIRESEAPNPNYKRPPAESLPPENEASKRRKVETSRYTLPPLSGLPSSSDLLPRIMTRPVIPLWPPKVSSMTIDSGPSVSVSGSEPNKYETDGQDRSPSPTESDAEASEDELWLPDVSFDNILPGEERGVENTEKDKMPHRANRALIQPDQVRRLPHLASYRQSICLDQVEALHQRLDKSAPESKEHLSELKKLTSLSRMLIKNLNDWRRLSTRAPDIPFSL